MLRFLFVLVPAVTVTHAAFAGVIATPVPEPSSLAILAAGIGAAAVYRRFRK